MQLGLFYKMKLFYSFKKISVLCIYDVTVIRYSLTLLQDNQKPWGRADLVLFHMIVQLRPAVRRDALWLEVSDEAATTSSRSNSGVPKRAARCSSVILYDGRLSCRKLKDRRLVLTAPFFTSLHRLVSIQKCPPVIVLPR